MGPKREGRKKGKGGRKRKGEEDDTDKAEDELAELDKHYYLNQIQALETKIQRATARCQQMEAVEKHTREQHQKMVEDKSDIVVYLTDRLTAKSNEIAELRSRLSGLIEAKKAEQAEFEKKLNNLKQEADYTKRDLRDQILALSRKLESLEEFGMHKEDLEAKLVRLEAELTEARQKHQNEVSVLEKAALLEATTLKNELQERMSQITEELRKAARAEVHGTTRRALLENQVLSQQGAALKAQVSQLRQQMKYTESSLADMQIRENLLQETMSRVTSRGEKRDKILQEMVARNESHTQMYLDYNILVNENEKLRRDLQAQQAQLDSANQMTLNLKEKVREKDIALELTSARLVEESTVRNHLMGYLRKALGTLQDVAFTDSSSGEATTTNVLQKLTVLLTDAEKSMDVSKEPKSDVEVTSKEPPLVTYEAGDLGLLPKEQTRKGKGTKQNKTES